MFRILQNPLKLYKTTELCVSGSDSRFSGWRAKNGMSRGPNITDNVDMKKLEIVSYSSKCCYNIHSSILKKVTFTL